MSSTFTFPGIYIQEVPSTVHTIVPAPTAVTAFVGRAIRGPINTPIRIHSFADFARSFGGLWTHSEMPYAVQQYFLNGGSDAYVVRAVTQSVLTATPVTISVPTGGGSLVLSAQNSGAWFQDVTVTVDLNTRKVNGARLPDEFNITLTYREKDPVTGAVSTTVETFPNLSYLATSGNYVVPTLLNDSSFIEVEPGSTVPQAQPTAGSYHGVAGSDGVALVRADLTAAALSSTKNGIYALRDAQIFTIMVLPPYAPQENGGTIDLDLTYAGIWADALAFCKAERAILLVDPPSPATWVDEPHALTALTSATPPLDNVRDPNSALYYPWVQSSDALIGSRTRNFAPSATVAGVMARIDATRGVWKSPAGQEAKLLGVAALQYLLTDAENGNLNPLGINCLRTFPIIGSVVWGARTLEGADVQASEWKYLAVRRMALFIEDSLYNGTGWAVFEPNDEPLWSELRLNVGAFMRNLFRQGAFQGLTPQQAYFVKCDSDTTTQNDIDNGVVNILVGFAPLKPAEFIVIKISQIAGDIAV